MNCLIGIGEHSAKKIGATFISIPRPNPTRRRPKPSIIGPKETLIVIAPPIKKRSAIIKVYLLPSLSAKKSDSMAPAVPARMA